MPTEIEEHQQNIENQLVSMCIFSVIFEEIQNILLSK